jgi:hypothetical protein
MLGWSGRGEGVVKNAIAAVLPLQYTVDRTEHSIVYKSLEWDDLQWLLLDPVQFFADEEDLWRPATAAAELPFLPWALLPPVTLVLEHAAASARSLTTFAAESDAEISELFGTAMLGVPTRDEQQFEILGTLHGRHPGGAFTAEFAADTSTLRVQYLPPKNPGGHRYRRQIDCPTHVESMLMGRKTHGTVHFDIGCSPAHRARFLMDYIENPGRICDILSGDERMRTTTVQYATPGEPIEIPDESRFGVGSQVRFVPPRALSNRTVVVEGLSDVEPACVCVEGNTYKLPDGTWMVGGIHCKRYVEPFP